jgi:hypothetical protein
MVALKYLELSYGSDDESSFCVLDDAVKAAPPSDVPAPSDVVAGRRQKLSVRFYHKDEIYAIPSLSQLSDEERQSLYVTKEENYNMKWELRNSLRRTINDASSPTNDTHSPATTTADDPLEDDEMRGLEIYTPVAQRERRQRIGRALQALLREQRISGKISESWLLYVYQDMTATSAWDAHMRGIMDQQVHRAGPPPMQIMIR